MTPRLLWRPFEALGPDELYALLRLRADVFVVEQNCVFADIDGKDPAARHLLAFAGEALAGYLRVFSPSAPAEAAKIGRVVVAPAFRATGLGRRLMAAALDEIGERFGPVPIELAAQSHLERFYAGFGFSRCSEDYLEDGIRHCDMRRGA